MGENLPSINFSEVLRDLEALQSAQPEGFTTREMMQATGRSDKWCRERLRILIGSGKVRFNGKKKIETIAGGACLTNVYTTTGA